MTAAYTTCTNRRLLEILGTSQLDNHKQSNSCDFSNLFCDSLLDNITECNYIDCPSLDLPDTYPSVDHQTTLIFLHINIRSINNLKFFVALYEFFTSLPYPSDIVGVSETCLKGDPLINISQPNYNFIHADSPTNAGRVAIYILSKCKYEMNTVGCEDLWLNIFLNNKSLGK